MKDNMLTKLKELIKIGWCVGCNAIRLADQDGLCLKCEEGVKLASCKCSFCTSN